MVIESTFHLSEEVVRALKLRAVNERDDYHQKYYQAFDLYGKQNGVYQHNNRDRIPDDIEFSWIICCNRKVKDRDGQFTNVKAQHYQTEHRLAARH